MEIIGYFLATAFGVAVLSLGVLALLAAFWRSHTRPKVWVMLAAFLLAAVAIVSYTLALSIGAPAFAWLTFGPLVLALLPGIWLLAWPSRVRGNPAV